jgi:hypothetical protein
MNHLRDLHSIGPEGTIVRPPRSQPLTPTLGRAPSMLDSYCAAASKRNAAAAAFDHEIFRGLLTLLRHRTNTSTEGRVTGPEGSTDLLQCTL